MTQYRVGADGALVLDEQGRVVARLRAGLVVVPAPSPGSAPAPETSRRTAYDDKVVRPEHGPTASKPTPPRQPDERLRNPLAGTG